MHEARMASSEECSFACAINARLRCEHEQTARRKDSGEEAAEAARRQRLHE
jgi:hypothetical protein